VDWCIIGQGFDGGSVDKIGGHKKRLIPILHRHGQGGPSTSRQSGGACAQPRHSVDGYVDMRLDGRCQVCERGS
jgi:hypothetical protein